MAKKNIQSSNIDSKIKKVAAKIKANSKDAHFADTLIEELLSLKGQKDVEPMELCVPSKEVIKTYDYDSFEIIHCKGGFLFHCKGGYYAYVTPRMRALFEHFATIVDMKERLEELTTDEKTLYENLFSATTMIMQIPIFAPSGVKMFFSVANHAAKELNSYCEELMKMPLKEEDYKANAEYENTISAIEEIAKIKKDVE